MHWLAPTTGWIAAAIAVPALVALYFLKLRRRQEIVSSTLLWQRAIQDLQVNAPFQRLRRNLLLLLQLLVLGALLLALARPTTSLGTGPARRYVLLIDQSASMRATDVSPSRLAEAKAQARRFVEGLHRRVALGTGGGSDQAMVMAFAAAPKVLCNFTSDRRQLLAAIDAVAPTDGPSRLAEALAVARAFAGSPGADANNRSNTPLARLELFSDGRIADLSDVEAAAEELTFHRIGTGGDNLAVVAMQHRRDYERPQDLSIFATVANYSPRPATCDVQLSLGSDLQAVRTVEVPAAGAAPARPGEPAGGPGQTSVTFNLVHPGSGVVEVRLRGAQADILAADDAAWNVVPPPRKLRVLLVSGGNVALATALEALPLGELVRRTPAEFDASVDAVAEAGYDVIVLDNHPAGRLVRGRYLVLGAPPPPLGVGAAPRDDDQMMADWLSRHPVLQHVSLENFFADRSYRLDVPRDAQVLAHFGDGPALALLRREGSVHLLAAFDVQQTNWPFEPGFVMFLYNALSFLGSEIDQDQRAALPVGADLTFRAPAGVTAATLAGPGLPPTALTVDAAGVFRHPAATSAGVYRAAMAGRDDRLFAVNLLDEAESDLAPAAVLEVSGTSVAGQGGSAGPVSEELWPFLAAAAVALVLLEWIVYNAKVRL